MKTHRIFSISVILVGLSWQFSARAIDFIVKNGQKESAKPGEVIPVSEKDVRIIDRTLAIFGDPSKWSKQDDGECPPYKTTYTLHCAMWRATEEIMGEYDHRQGALEEVRRTIEQKFPNKYEHRLTGYNNDPATKLDDIRNVLKETRSRISARLKTHSKHHDNDTAVKKN